MTLPNGVDNPSLTPDDLKKLTSDLGAEIDQEIKKQLSVPHPFAETQERIDGQVEQAVEKSASAEPTNLAPAGVAPPSDTKVSNPAPVDEVLTNPDPLQASVSAAMSELKEGEKIGQDWILKKIYSTSFGHNRSFFYELENQSGAKWTLNSEEMKDLIKSNVTDSTPKYLSPKTPVPEKGKLQTELEKRGPESVKKEEVETDETSTTSLSKDQIEFVSKLHADSKLWHAFTSFNPGQLKAVQDLYLNGQLPKIGIDAHPLLDKLESPQIGQEVVIKKGDSFTSLVENAGHSLTNSTKDSLLLALHILANEKLLIQGREKAEAAGLLVEKLPETKEIIRLGQKGLQGDTVAYSQLSQFVKLLPAESKLRVLSPEEATELEKYLTV